MKTKILFILLTLLSLSSCGASAKVKNAASGGRATRTITTGDPITSIENNTSLDVTVISSPNYFVTIDGPENVIDNLNVELRNGALVISVKKNISFEGTGTVKVSTDALRQVIAKSSGDFTVASFNGTRVVALVMGSGDLKAGTVEATSLTVQLQGSGDIEIGSVDASSTKVLLQGSGDVNIRKTVTTSLDCIIQGSGDVNAAGIQAVSVRGNCQGSGDLVLSGWTTSASYVMQGSGDINARNLKAKHATRSTLGSGEIYE